MKPLTVMADVPDLTAAVPAAHLRRVVGLLDDDQTVVVAKHVAGQNTAETEISFALGHAAELAHACLAGNRRALTTPGLARILSSTVAVLLRVSLAAGGVKSTGELHDGHAGHGDDRGAAAADEPDDS